MLACARIAPCHLPQLRNTNVQQLGRTGGPARARGASADAANVVARSSGGLGGQFGSSHPHVNPSMPLTSKSRWRSSWAYVVNAASTLGPLQALPRLETSWPAGRVDPCTRIAPYGSVALPSYVLSSAGGQANGGAARSLSPLVGLALHVHRVRYRTNLLRVYPPPLIHCLTASVPPPTVARAKAHPAKAGVAKPRLLVSSATPPPTPRGTPRPPSCRRACHTSRLWHHAALARRATVASRRRTAMRTPWPFLMNHFCGRQ
jgi:hypothetical protein